ncbi:MAG TPA: adenylate/guanylate cyclase domain-containing protein [Anaerolineales bacterium]|nr:adenylate/guanylate cyclase domain-containing protein [Anaerolineales bacterium]
MRSLPSGTVTFLFTDIESSTQLWEKHPDEMRSALAQHDSILREAITANNGHVIKTTGDGVHAVFEKAADAIRSTLVVQRALLTAGFFENPEAALRVRMGLHTGEAEFRDGDYFGQSLNRAARIMSIAHGGQILLSGITAEVIREHQPADAILQDLGEHPLKGLSRPEHLYQLGAPDLPQDFPAIKSSIQFPNNLPAQLTVFIGRERERAEVHEKLASARLLTLIGPGGTGKTRLSLQVGSEQAVHFKDGVWLVELAPISDPAYIVSAIASLFEIREVQNIPLIQLLIDFLLSKELLLILDNCEHLIEACAEVADQLLHACPNLKIIASSREALGIDGETVYRVPSLNDDEATHLFVERATKADSRFHVTEHNASFIAQICSRLDGIPLAIELAAARVKLFTPEQIAQRLDDRFRLLTGGSRTALPRQQTLRALIDWSYQSLNETEQRAFRRLAVFSGGWLFEAAESVIGEDDAMDGLMGLVNKSLVNVEEQNGQSRYRFLETIRQYAMEKLVESEEAAAVRDRHMEFMLNLTGYPSQRMFGTEDTEFLDHIESEHDNLRTALEWAVGNNLIHALKLAYALGGYWAVRDYNTEAHTWCNTILEKTAAMSDVDRERGRLYSLLGWIYVTIGEHKTGRLACEQSIALGMISNDILTVARAYSTLALTCIFLGDFSAAMNASEEGERLARQHDLKAELAFALSTRAQLEYFSRNDIDRAKECLLEAASLAKEAEFGWASSFMAIGLGHTAALVGDMEAARASFQESAELAKKLGNKRIVYSSQSEFAHILRQHGELDEPLATYRDLLPKWKDLGHRSAVAHELECIAYILTRKEEPERAVMLLGAAEAIRRLIDIPRTKMEHVEYENEIAAIRSGMVTAEFEDYWKKGNSLTIEQAIELALDENNTL